MPIPPFQNQRLHFLLSPLFRKLSQLSVQDQQNGKQAYCRLPPWYFRIILKDTLTHLTMESIVVCLSPQYLLNVFSNMYIPPWVRKKKLWILNYRKIHLESKNWIYCFLLMPPSKILRKVFIITPQTEEIYPRQRFFKIYFFPCFPLNFSRYRSHVLINPTIFGPCIFLVSVLPSHHLDSSMLGCEGSLT